MHTRHDAALEFVLNMGELARQIAHVVIVDEGDRTDGLFILIPLLPDKIVAYQVAKRFRSIRVFAPLDVVIERIQQMVIKRHAESNKLFHASPVLRFLNT